VTALARLRPLVAACIGGLMLGACSAPSAEEYETAMQTFDALPAEVKAWVCADDFYAVQYRVEGFVLVERCRQGTSVEATRSAPLSPEFEAADRAYAVDYYEQNPPEARQLSEVDAQRLCSLDDDELQRDIAAWRSSTTFPSWEGVEYVPSDEHEVARLEVWREVACPLLDG
jgi:hypothetical protein